MNHPRGLRRGEWRGSGSEAEEGEAVREDAMTTRYSPVDADAIELVIQVAKSGFALAIDIAACGRTWLTPPEG